MKNRFLAKYTGNIGQVGVLSEKATAKRLGAKQVRGSGANYYGLRADARVQDFAVECKSTIRESISIKREWLQKISKAALTEKRKPVLTVTFTDETSNPKEDGRWVMITEQDFISLMEERQ